MPRTVWCLDAAVALRFWIPLCCIRATRFVGTDRADGWIYFVGARFLFLSNRDIYKAAEYFGDRNIAEIFLHDFPRLALGQIQ